MLSPLTLALLRLRQLLLLLLLLLLPLLLLLLRILRRRLPGVVQWLRPWRLLRTAAPGPVLAEAGRHAGLTDPKAPEGWTGSARGSLGASPGAATATRPPSSERHGLSQQAARGG